MAQKIVPILNFSVESPILDDSTALGLFLHSKPDIPFNSSPRISYNKILLIGGCVNGRDTNEIIREYTVNEGCTLLVTKMACEREGHAAGFHPGTRELIVAGGDGASESCIFPFNADSKFTSLPNMNQKRSYFSSCVAGNRYYVFGGWNSNSGSLSHCEFFDFSLRSWKEIAALPVSLAHSSAICWKNGNNVESIFVFGGRNGSTRGNSSANTVYEYNIGDNTWKRRQHLYMPKPVYSHAIVNFNGKVIVCGGFNIPDSPYFKSCYSLDMSTGVWSDFPSLNVGRYNHAAVVVGGQIVVMGGRGGEGDLKSVEVFNGNKWVMGKELGHTISHFSAVVV